MGMVKDSQSGGMARMRKVGVRQRLGRGVHGKGRAVYRKVL